MLPAVPFAGPTVTCRLPVVQTGSPAATGWAGVVGGGPAGPAEVGPAGAGAGGVAEAAGGAVAGGTLLTLGRAGPAGLPPAAVCPPLQAATRAVAASPAAASAALAARERTTDIGATFLRRRRGRGTAPPASRPARCRPAPVRTPQRPGWL